MLTASDTAFAIASIRAEEATRPPSNRLFDDPYAALFEARGAHAREGTLRFRSLPFFVDGIRLRTRGIDDLLLAGLDAGLKQVVLLGAGFDCRALRMPQIGAGGASVFEVDLPHVLATKRAALADGGVELPAFVHHVPCDFAAPDFESQLSRDLAGAGFRLRGGAFFVWEGVTAYLGNAAVAQSLAFMASAGGPESRVALDFAVGLDADPMEARVQRAGFTSFEAIAFDDLYRTHLGGEPHEAAAICRLGLAILD